MSLAVFLSAMGIMLFGLVIFELDIHIVMLLALTFACIVSAPLGYTRSPRFGHVADGNFHNFILMVDGKVPEWADDMRRDVYKAALKYGGTVTAEHGTGKTRKPYMELQYTPHVLEIMRNIKRAFDPNNILNPGVIVDL